jgi:hypothetical protein
MRVKGDKGNKARKKGAVKIEKKKKKKKGEVERE